MTEATCALLATIFPLMLVTGVIERRSANLNIRRLPIYRAVSIVTFAASLMGTGYAVIGVQAQGFADLHAAMLWILFALGMVGLAITLLGSLATAEVEEGADSD